jgi:16S rRNA (uracil1498-N3)-methyltransferase
LESIEIKDGLCTITGSEAKHMARVLRTKPGDSMVLMDRKGSRVQAIIRSVTPREVLVAIERALPAPPSSPVEITLCQALLKSGAMDFVVQKTSELGVDRIIPFFSERTVVSLNRERAASRLRHWQEIARNASKQSNRARPPEIVLPEPLEHTLTQWGKHKALKVITWEEERAKDLKCILRTPFAGRKVVGMVGPEGGFSPEEIGQAGEAGFISASLGPRTLRSETAALALVTLVQYEWGDLAMEMA